MREFDEDEFGDPEGMRALEESASMERMLAPEKSGAELAESILEDAAPLAAQSIVRIATNDPNSRVRLSASQYIVDRVLGKAGAVIGVEPVRRPDRQHLLQEILVVLE